MLKRSLSIAAMLLGLAASMSAAGAVIGFSGPFDPSTWTTSFVGDVLPPGAADNGSVNTAGAPNSITIIGGDDPNNPDGAFNSCIGGDLFGCEIRYSHPAFGLPISFNWSYTTNDSCGAQCDIFGVLINGVEQILSDAGGLATQSGTFRFSPGLTTIGFFESCGMDCGGGAARSIISQLAIPEPGSIALLGLGLTALFGIRRRGVRTRT